MHFVLRSCEADIGRAFEGDTSTGIRTSDHKNGLDTYIRVQKDHNPGGEADIGRAFEGDTSTGIRTSDHKNGLDTYIRVQKDHNPGGEADIGRAFEGDTSTGIRTSDHKNGLDTYIRVQKDHNPGGEADIGRAFEGDTSTGIRTSDHKNGLDTYIRVQKDHNPGGEADIGRAFEGDTSTGIRTSDHKNGLDTYIRVQKDHNPGGEADIGRAFEGDTSTGIRTSDHKNGLDTYIRVQKDHRATRITAAKMIAGQRRPLEAAILLYWHKVCLHGRCKRAATASELRSAQLAERGAAAALALAASNARALQAATTIAAYAAILALASRTKRGTAFVALAAWRGVVASCRRRTQLRRRSEVAAAALQVVSAKMLVHSILACWRMRMSEKRSAKSVEEVTRRHRQLLAERGAKAAAALAPRGGRAQLGLYLRAWHYLAAQGGRKQALRSRGAAAVAALEVGHARSLLGTLIGLWRCLLQEKAPTLSFSRMLRPRGKGFESGALASWTYTVNEAHGAFCGSSSVLGPLGAALRRGAAVLARGGDNVARVAFQGWMQVIREQHMHSVRIELDQLRSRLVLRGSQAALAMGRNCDRGLLAECLNAWQQVCAAERYQFSLENTHVLPQQLDQLNQLVNRHQRSLPAVREGIVKLMAQNLAPDQSAFVVSSVFAGVGRGLLIPRAPATYPKVASFLAQNSRASLLELLKARRLVMDFQEWRRHAASKALAWAFGGRQQKAAGSSAVLLQLGNSDVRHIGHLAQCTLFGCRMEFPKPGATLAAELRLRSAEDDAAAVLRLRGEKFVLWHLGGGLRALLHRGLLAWAGLAGKKGTEHGMGSEDLPSRFLLGYFHRLRPWAVKGGLFVLEILELFAWRRVAYLAQVTLAKPDKADGRPSVGLQVRRTDGKKVIVWLQPSFGGVMSAPGMPHGISASIFWADTSGAGKHGAGATRSSRLGLAVVVPWLLRAESNFGVAAVFSEWHRASASVQKWRLIQDRQACVADLRDRSLRLLDRRGIGESPALLQSAMLAWAHTDTQTHRHTDTQTHRHTDTQTHRHTDTQTHRHTDTQTHRHTDTQTHRHTDTQTHRHTDTQTHRHTDTQTHRHTDTQTHRHTDTQTHRHTDTQKAACGRKAAERGATALSAASTALLLGQVIFRWREQCALVRRAVNDREKVQSQGDVKARGCSAAQVLAAQGSRALRAQVFLAWRTTLRRPQQMLLALWAPRKAAQLHSGRRIVAAKAMGGQACMARAAFAALQNVAAEGRVAAVEELASSQLTDLVDWQGDRWRNRLLASKLFAAWRNAVLRLSFVLHAALSRELQGYWWLRNAVFGQWRLQLQRSQEDHAREVHQELRQQLQWQGTVAFAARRVGEDVARKSRLFRAWAHRTSAFRTAALQGQRLRRGGILQIAIQALGSWRLVCKEHQWSLKQQELADLLAEAGTQLMQAGGLEMERRRTFHPGRRLALHLIFLTLQACAARAFDAWRRKMLLQRSEQHQALACLRCWRATSAQRRRAIAAAVRFRQRRWVRLLTAAVRLWALEAARNAEPETSCMQCGESPRFMATLMGMKVCDMPKSEDMRQGLRTDAVVRAMGPRKPAANYLLMKHAGADTYAVGHGMHKMLLHGALGSQISPCLGICLLKIKTEAASNDGAAAMLTGYC
ncbi:hypothetical protein AK812_SmicGene23620 [Symbiodinium microadriaticum]|uniref:Uncharacterized protein n=1 Tax=Symbiodinium microadriaticum TaxID=2951 RepID=A0A1Q9DGQ5_SYMMI|nr:hypothetical protein AK812_SmicGene23620 [Symbiodinium microadriaticum]